MFVRQVTIVCTAGGMIFRLYCRCRYLLRQVISSVLQVEIFLRQVTYSVLQVQMFLRHVNIVSFAGAGNIFTAAGGDIRNARGDTCDVAGNTS